MIEILREHRGGGAIQTVKVRTKLNFSDKAPVRCFQREAGACKNIQISTADVHVSSAAVQLSARVPGKVRRLPGEPGGDSGALGVSMTREPQTLHFNRII